MVQPHGTTMWFKVQPWTGLRTPLPNGNGASIVSIGCAPASELSRRLSRGQGQTPGRGKATRTFSARVVINTNNTN